MVTSDIRQQVHQLVDQANENQLDAVFELLQSSSSSYTQEELDSFYKRARQFEESGSKGFSVEESHAWIRNKYKERGV